MKQFVILFVLVGVTFAQFGEGPQEILVAMKTGLGMLLDESTETGFNSDVNYYIHQEKTKGSFCFDPTVECTESWYLGCSCTNAFIQAGDGCAQTPCKIYNFVYNDLAKALQQFVDEAEDIRSAINLVAEQIYAPLMSIVCECAPGFYDATFQCIRNFDGDFMDSMGSTKVIYQTLVENMLDLEAMQNVMTAIMEPACKDNCINEFSDMWTSWGAMMDKMFDEKVSRKSCKSWKRLAKEMEQLSNAMENVVQNGVQELNGFLKAYIRMEKKAWCQEKCQSKMLNTFYGCCHANAIEIYEEMELSKNVYRMIQNMMSLMSMAIEDMDTSIGDRITQETVDKYFAAMNPVELCSGGRMNLYEEKNQQCMAEEM